MRNSINLVLFQTDIIWEDPSANYLNIEKYLDNIEEPVDLLALPETFTTGFSMNADKYAGSGNETISWMRDIARKKQCALSGTVTIREGDHFYNRHYFVNKEGGLFQYDKRHLFKIGGEQDLFHPGKERVVVHVGAFRILLQTCYDLRFPVFSRCRGDYDAILYAANWPGARQHVWETLLRARAIENQAYVIGINRSGGVDGEGVEYAGGSCLVNPLGIVTEQMDDAPGIRIIQLDINEVQTLREKFPVSEDADDFSIRGVKME